MHRRVLILAVVVLAVLGNLAAQADGQRRGRGGPQWELLGVRVVTDRADHDTVVVTRAKGTFTAVRFDVEGHAVDFQRVVITFGNDETQSVALRATIPAGGSSRVIDVEGADRVIKKIDFWYDAKTLGRGGKATVRVMARE